MSCRHAIYFSDANSRFTSLRIGLAPNPGNLSYTLSNNDSFAYGP
nr:MAG TPA: hypothetical protein [Caudoviricetes sp.]